MLILCLDSSGPELKSGLFEDNVSLAESSSNSMGNHSERIIFEIQQILGDSGRDLRDVDRLAINLGPGSFTGLRIGLAAMAGLSLSKIIPLVGYNAFEIMAEDIKDAEGKYLAVIPCRGNDFYSVQLKSSNRIVSRSSEYQIISPGNLDRFEERMILIGSGAASFFGIADKNLREKLELNEDYSQAPTLKSLSHLAGQINIKKDDNLRIPELFYIAPSQAEVNYARKRAGNSN